MGNPDFAPFSFLQIYAYVFENIKSVQLEALLLSLLSIVVLVLVKELNEQFKRKIKVVLPVDLVLVSMRSITLSCFWRGGRAKSADTSYIFSSNPRPFLCLINERLICMDIH